MPEQKDPYVLMQSGRLLARRLKNQGDDVAAEVIDELIDALFTATVKDESGWANPGMTIGFG